MGMALDGTHKVLHYSFTGDAPAHPSGWSVIAPHGFNSVMLQATIAIFLLCGFESITSLGEEAKNPKRISLAVFCSHCSSRACSVTCSNILQRTTF
jgi:amino acid transporter